MEMYIRVKRLKLMVICLTLTICLPLFLKEKATECLGGCHLKTISFLAFLKPRFRDFLNKNRIEVNTNLNGEERAMVVTGEMEKVFPMDIFPMQLVKACLNQDIERMEALGIYEVVPEDFGLIDFSSSSKIEAQEIIKKGIELIINEES